MHHADRDDRPPFAEGSDVRRLWFRLREGGQTGFIVGDTHTHPGRFVVQVDGEQRPRNCSQHELAEVSPETALWLSGYLHGSVPQWPEDDDERLMKEWREKRAIFLRSGAWPGRDDYTSAYSAHALDIGAVVRVEPRAGGDPELEEARDRLGVIQQLVEPSESGDQPEYFVMLEGEGFVISEGDLVPTGEHRADYEPDPRYACPCCGFLTLSEGPGSYEICPVCYWEDDDVQLARPDVGGGANSVSLNEARENFRREGVSEPRFKDKVRRPAAWEYPRPAVVSPRGEPVAFAWPRLP